MTDLVERPDLYPVDDETPIITALVAVDGRLDDSAMTSIVEVKDAEKASPGFLPFLAWERSADVYSDAWPEPVRRAAIEAAPDLHRQKGTVYAIKRALSALGIDADVTEWWQTAPRGAPYSFSVKAYARARLYDGPLLDDRLIAVAFNAVLAIKPVSRAFDFSIGAKAETALGLAPALIGKVRLGLGTRPRPIPSSHRAAIVLAPIVIGRVRLALSAAPVLPSDGALP